MSMNRSVYLMVGIKVKRSETLGDAIWEDEYLEKLTGGQGENIEIVHGGEGDYDNLYIGKVLFQFDDQNYDEETTVFDFIESDRFDIASGINETFKDYMMPHVSFNDIHMMSVVSWG